MGNYIPLFFGCALILSSIYLGFARAITSRARLGFPSPNRYRAAQLSAAAPHSARKRRLLQSWPWSCKNTIWSLGKHKRTRRRSCFAYLPTRRSATHFSGRRRRIGTASKMTEKTLQLHALRISPSRSSEPPLLVNMCYGTAEENNIHLSLFPYNHSHGCRSWSAPIGEAALALPTQSGVLLREIGARLSASRTDFKWRTALDISSVDVLAKPKTRPFLRFSPR